MEWVVKKGPIDRKAAETSGPTGTAGAPQQRNTIILRPLFDFHQSGAFQNTDMSHLLVVSS